MDKLNDILRRIINFFGSLHLALGSLLFFGMTLALAALFFFGWLADEMLEGDTRNFDESVRQTIHQFANPALTAVMQFASFLGSTVFLTVLGIIVFIVFYFLKRRRAAIIFAVTTIGAAILLVTLKYAFRRTRPEPFFDTILPASYSFPSGHSLASFCFYGALAAIVTVRVEKLWLKAIIWTTAATLILLIGISRIYLGVHHPSDVLAGFVVGLIWVVTISVGDKLIHVKKETNVEK